MRLIRFADLRETSWKNGGGTTTEIAVFPQGAGFEDFGWRISMARVAGEGPFSRFAGIDRTLTLIEGAGMRLAIEGHEAVTLTTDSAPLPFRGDVATEAWLVNGPIRDLNVMTRRGLWTHEVRRLAGKTEIAADGPMIVVALGEAGFEDETLGFGDTALLDQGERKIFCGKGLMIELREAPTGR